MVSFFSLAAANEALQVHTQRACPEPPDNVRMHASTVLQQRRVVGNMRRVRGHPAPGLTDQPPSVARLARGATGQVAASLPDSTNFYLRKFRCLAWPGQRVRWPWLTMHEAIFIFCNHHFAQQEHLLFKIIQSLLRVGERWSEKTSKPIFLS